MLKSEPRYSAYAAILRAHLIPAMGCTEPIAIAYAAAVARRALGWITYLERPEGNVMGHTGFTGTSIWMDMATGDYLIFLTNRVHPTRNNEYPVPIRRAAFKIAFDAEL